MFLEVKQSHWSEEHAARHEVTMAEIREAILERPYYQRQGRSDSLLCYGQTYAGKVPARRSGRGFTGIAFVVTAREMTRSEKKTFQREAR